METRQRVLELWKQGWTYASISKLTGYSVWSVGEIVRAALRQLRSNRTLEEHRADHLARLEEMYEQVFPMLMHNTADRGDVASLLAILDRQSRLLGLDAPRRVVTSVGIPSNEAEMREFVATLMEALGRYNRERTEEVTNGEHAGLPPAQEPCRYVHLSLEKVPARVVPAETVMPTATVLERVNDASEAPEKVVALVDKAERERRAELQARMEAIYAV